MEFLEQVKYFIMGLAAVAVILLLYFLFGYVGYGGARGWELDFSNTISGSSSGGPLNWIRGPLIIMEGIWLLGWAAFYFLFARKVTEGKDEATIKKIEAFEPKYFTGVAFFLLFLLILSFAVPALTIDDGLRHFHGEDDDADVTLYVISYTFNFYIDNTTDHSAYDSVKAGNDVGGLPGFQDYDFKTDVRYRFLIVSMDTNHGFGVYNPDGELMGQTQIVSGYENLYYETFETAGTHQILCMEYCGRGHHGMVVDFEVSN